jgi:hypothetical protein
MATRTTRSSGGTERAKKVSHPVEMLREVYALRDVERRLRAIAAGLQISEGTSIPYLCLLRGVLRDSIVAEAHGLSVIGARLNGLLGPDAAELNGGA